MIVVGGQEILFRTPLQGRKPVLAQELGKRETVRPTKKPSEA